MLHFYVLNYNNFFKNSDQDWKNVFLGHKKQMCFRKIILTSVCIHGGASNSHLIIHLLPMYDAFITHLLFELRKISNAKLQNFWVSLWALPFSSMKFIQARQNLRKITECPGTLHICGNKLTNSYFFYFLEVSKMTSEIGFLKLFFF